MKSLLSFLVFAAAVSSAYAQGNTTSSKEIQIKTAVLAAPTEKQKGASVMGYDSNGELVELRKGSNEMICIADDPNGKGFSVSCYQADLEPFMQRGRELKAEGKAFQEIFDIREEEAKSGKLQMPKDGATLFVLSADTFEPSSGKVDDTYLRYVVYLPWATPETTGLPLKPDAPGMPWLMDPGTHRAHIMITPPREE